MTKKKWLRILLPAALLIIWFGVASFGGPAFGKISDVSTNDQAAFLPSSAESTQVQQLQRQYENGQAIPAIVLLESEQKFNPSDLNAYKELSKKMSEVDGVKQPVIGPLPSEDFKALEFIVPVSVEEELKVVVEGLRSVAQKDLPDGIQAYVSGPAGLSADLAKAFGGVDGLLLAVALTAVFIILVFVYRAVLLPILVLVNSVFALSAAIFVVYLLAKNGVIELNGQSQGILSILVIGAATDYSLLFVARYREALGKVSSKWEAIVQGIKGSIEPIMASAATVILALLCLLFSDLNSNRSLGPIAATGIVFAFLATLTFLPALLGVFGRVAFWPSKIQQTSKKKSVAIKTGHEELTGVWKRVGHLVATYPRKVWAGIVVVLALGSLGLTQLKASGVPQTDLVLTQSNSVEGQKAIERHYDAGSGAPMLVSVPQKSAEQALAFLESDKNISEIMVYGERGRTSDIESAKIIDDKILLSATLTVDPYSEEAEEAIESIRSALNNKAPNSLVGGTTAIAVDTNNTAQSDLRKIVPLVLLMIYIVLALLLRALLAPLILIATVVLSFAATLGVSALVFNHVFGFSGADATVPLFGFVFLVALGIDYNIFLITRTREEALKYGTRPAIFHSLGKTGGVITSAGVVLAATFAALGVIPILFLVQLAFIVAFGVLLDALIVRTLLVPALFNQIGSKVWWPSKKITK